MSLQPRRSDSNPSIDCGREVQGSPTIALWRSRSVANFRMVTSLCRQATDSGASTRKVARLRRSKESRAYARPPRAAVNYGREFGSRRTFRDELARVSIQ